ncbi:molybdopterin-dependent oxidoreductase [Actinoplanes sp. NPDC051411]|uniref:molybdopterin-dependent oxidoreductase n=1 Tax=Actinoplanes sp. NPDC051411 TaxID=3155522 RepID=UPI0034377534
MKSSLRAGFAGVAAAAVALGVAEIVAVLTGPLSAPLLAVGGVVVDNVPGPVKDFGVQVFGVHDKTALITGTALLLAAYAFGVGVVARRHWRVALVGVAVFGLVGVVAAMTRHDASALAALPSLVGTGLAVPVLRYLLGVAEDAAEPEPVAVLAVDSVAVGGAAVDSEAKIVVPDRSTRPHPVPGRGRSAGAGNEDKTGADKTGADKSGGNNSGGNNSGRSNGSRNGAGGRDYAYVLESRRRFLKALGIAAGVAVASGLAGRFLTSRQAVTEARNAIRLPVPREPAPTLPAGVQVPGASPYVVPNGDFYRIDTALYPPQVDPSNWSLTIHGMVRNPITITWEQLLQRPMIERYVTLTCVSNEVGGDLVGNALWLGTPIKALLEEAGVLPGADQVIQRSVDGWTCGSPTSVLMDGRDALLSVGMNGQPLPIDHGFPVRMVVPGLYGYVSACKWITEIELSRFSDFDAYWVPRGWSQQAPIKTESRIDTPRDGSKRKAGTVAVAGVAWAQHRGVSKVEVQVDDGPWQPATLAATVSSDTWREWSYPWPATSGKHTVRVRATDATGETQTSEPADPAPNGASGWHTIQVQVD